MIAAIFITYAVVQDLLPDELSVAAGVATEPAALLLVLWYVLGLLVQEVS